MVCCWNNIYQGIEKIKAWNVAFWNIMVQGHHSFVIVLNVSCKFVFINRSMEIYVSMTGGIAAWKVSNGVFSGPYLDTFHEVNWNFECQGLWLGLASD